MGDTEQRTGRVYAGYIGTRSGDAEPVRDGVVVRSSGTPPVMTRRVRLGDVDCCVFEGGDADVSPHRWQSANDGIVAGYVASGSVEVMQDGRTVVLTAGQVVLYDGVTPYRLRSPGRHRFLIAHVRLVALRLHREDRDVLVARDLSSNAAATALAALLGTVAAHDHEPNAVVLQHLGDAVVSCLHGIVADVRGVTVGDRSTALFEELTDWLDAHLADPVLTAESLADEHFLSARYVRKVFADHGSTVSAYVRQRRLERIRDELLQPWTVHLPVSTIAARWGFPDPSVFTRVFTRQFGRGPQRFRRDAALASGRSPRND
jgi:AraC-like DNA-binding protein